MDKKTKNNNKKVRVRFAPSPTGFLHIGSARTALFNWLYAQKYGGRFIIRIEDTDVVRHQEKTVNLTLDSLKWLGLHWDEGPDIGGKYFPYRQSMRTNIYKEYAKKLVQEKKAYYCFCSPEELKSKREKAIKDGKFYKYDRKCLNLSNDDIKKNIENGKKHAIRFLVPENKTIAFIDNVYGKITINSNIIEDFIIIRSNGLPTYNFSVSIDDALMKISHIIRGEDHLSNTPKQILIYNALNLTTPNFTHLPMILGHDGQKLSKRHGAISIESYREEGFLPQAILNYLSLLGWAYDEKTTIFSISELINKFSINSITKKPAKFDYSKLLWMNGYYIRKMEDKNLKEVIKERVSGKILTKVDHRDKYIFKGKKEDLDKKIKKIIPIVKERLKTFSECDRLISPFFLKVKYSSKMENYFKNKKINAVEILNEVIAYLSKIDEENVTGNTNFNAKKIEKNLRLISEELRLSFRKIAEVIRIAIWGSTISLPLFETIEILGKEETLKRLEHYKNRLNNQP